MIASDSNTHQIKKIVIVGGGTAGWLAANHLAKNLMTKRENSVEVILIESPNIPTIGVGEGTVPMMRQSLMHLGISETEFITQCDATFKQGIKFVDWVKNPVQGKPDFYHHIFDYPNITEIDLTPYWLKNYSSRGVSFVDTVSFQGKICDAGLAPKTITTPEFQGMVAYAYHLDAGKFAALLTKNAVNKLGVKHLVTEVNHITQHENGEIRSVITDTNGEIFADFFVDCTGFKALLIGDTLKVPFKDKSDILFADHAIAIQVPYDHPQADIPSFTLSSALQSGWVWDIGLKQRRGIGHVYSSSHTTHEKAEQDLRDYIGKAAEGISSRKISMNIGYREKFWQKNCVSLGLAQGFVEPLEATGLLVFDATAKMLAEQFPSSKIDMPLIADEFNKRVTESWENVVDFVKMHYCLSQRTDSDFWLDNRANSSIPESLMNRLERWKHQPPSPYDFSSKFAIFNLENYLYVMYGMHFPTNVDCFSHRLSGEELASKQIEFINQQTHILLERLPKHRELIDKIHLYGLQKY